MRVLALSPGGEDLVRRDRDGLDLLHLARVLADLLGSEGGASQQLVAPLPRGDGVRDEDERRGLRGGHRPGTDEGLAGAAGEHHDTGAAVEEVVDGLLLVVAQVPVGLVEVDRMRRARRVPGEVLGRPPELHELLLQRAARPRGDEEAVVVDALGEQRRDAPRSGHLGEHGDIGGVQAQRALIGAVDHEPAVTGDGLAHVDGHRLRHRELGVPLERAEHVLGIVARRSGVPEPEARDAIGVHVLGCAFELGEDREVVSRVLGERVRDLEEHGAIALHDERAV